MRCRTFLVPIFAVVVGSLGFAGTTPPGSPLPLRPSADFDALLAQYEEPEPEDEDYIQVLFTHERHGEIAFGRLHGAAFVRLFQILINQETQADYDLLPRSAGGKESEIIDIIPESIRNGRTVIIGAGLIRTHPKLWFYIVTRPEPDNGGPCIFLLFDSKDEFLPVGRLPQARFSVVSAWQTRGQSEELSLILRCEEGLGLQKLRAFLWTGDTNELVLPDGPRGEICTAGRLNGSDGRQSYSLFRVTDFGGEPFDFYDLYVNQNYVGELRIAAVRGVMPHILSMGVVLGTAAPSWYLLMHDNTTKLFLLVSKMLKQPHVRELELVGDIPDWIDNDVVVQIDVMEEGRCRVVSSRPQQRRVPARTRSSLFIGRGQRSSTELSPRTEFTRLFPEEQKPSSPKKGESPRRFFDFLKKK